MTTLEIVLAVACVALAVAFVVMRRAAKDFQEAFNTSDRAFKSLHQSFQESCSIVSDYQRRDRERRERQ